MLIEVRIANYRAFRDEQVFTLVGSNYIRSHSDNLISASLPGLAGVKLLKGAAVYGANASGKTTLVKAMEFLDTFVNNSATEQSQDMEIPVEPFLLEPHFSELPSRFELTFVSSNVRYTFGLKVTKSAIHEEYLIAYPKGLPQKWYHRTLVPGTENYEWSSFSPSFKRAGYLRDRVRPNSLFLSVGAQFNHAQLRPVFDWFRKNLYILELSERFSNNYTLRQLSKIDRGPKVQSMLCKADLGIVDTIVEEKEFTTTEELSRVFSADFLSQMVESKPDKKILSATFVHSTAANGGTPLDYSVESAGTRRFFALLGPWVDILESGHVVFIDELETSLHPILVRELLQQVMSERGNPNGAQIVFTTHSTPLLDSELLRRDQVWFTEKDGQGASHLYPLTDFHPRVDESLGKGYLSGRYGAIPFLGGNIGE